MKNFTLNDKFAYVVVVAYFVTGSVISSFLV